MNLCQYCKIETTAQLCSVCDAMREAILAQPGLVHAQLEYQRENIRRIRAKARMLGAVEPKDQ